MKHPVFPISSNFAFSSFKSCVREIVDVKRNIKLNILKLRKNYMFQNDIKLGFIFIFIIKFIFLHFAPNDVKVIIYFNFL